MFYDEAYNQIEQAANAANPADEIESAMNEVDRDDTPDLLSEAYTDGLIDDTWLPRLLPIAWSSPDSPIDALGEAEWRTLWSAAGFAIDGVPAPRPNEPVHLFRGADVGSARGWSWTPDIELAEFFTGFRCTPGSRGVWQVMATPEAILAVITNERPGETEYVLDPAMLPDVSLTDRVPIRLAA